MKPRYELLDVPAGTTFTCFRRQEEHFTFSWHHHREYELTLITEGSGMRYVGTTVEPYEPGDLVLLGPDLPHTFSSVPTPEGRAGAAVAQFRADFLGPGFFELPQFAAVGALLRRSVRGIAFAPAPPRIHDTVARLPSLEPAVGTLALLDVLHHLAVSGTGHELTGPGYAESPGTEVSERIDRVCRHLERAHTGRVELAEVAALIPMAPTSFSRFFRQTMGRTLTDHVNHLRVETACRLLVDTELPITEVAARSGFANLSNFNRRFRELKGQRPREHRAAYTRPVR